MGQASQAKTLHIKRERQKNKKRLARIAKAAKKLRKKGSAAIGGSIALRP